MLQVLPPPISFTPHLWRKQPWEMLDSWGGWSGQLAGGKPHETKLGWVIQQHWSMQLVCAHLLSWGGGLPAARTTAKQPGLRSCFCWSVWVQRGRAAADRRDPLWCKCSRNSPLTPLPWTGSSWTPSLHFCFPSLLASQGCLWLFPALPVFFSHGNYFSISSALMPFPDPRLPDLPLMLITESGLGGSFLYHTLLKQTLFSLWIFKLC